jgi:hypothetical protein
MKHLNYISAFLAMASAHAYGDLFLKSEATGREYGPFAFQDGEEVVLGKSVFTVVERVDATSQKPSGRLDDELKNVRFPVTEFRHAAAEDCARYVEDQLAERRPDLAVRVVVKRPKAFRVIDPDRMDPFAESARFEGREQSRVTLREVNGSAYALLKEIADQSGFQIRFTTRMVTLFQ